jgi:hypothetical protein
MTTRLAATLTAKAMKVRFHVITDKKTIHKNMCYGLFAAILLRELAFVYLKRKHNYRNYDDNP